MKKNIETIKLDNKKRRSFWRPVALFALGLVAGIGLSRTGGLTLHLAGSKSISSNTNLPADLDYSSVEKVYDALRKDYDGELKKEDILNGLKAGLAQATKDPYTTFFTPEDNEAFDSEISGTFTGIGAELLQENGVVIISTPLSGFPAEKAGVKARDIILKINDEDATSLNVADAVKKIRGEKGTVVTLTLLRGDQKLDIPITRDTITIPSVTYKIDENNIGYMQLTRFGQDTGKLAGDAATEFKAKNVKGIIVDVRNNPGGYLDQAVSVASLWVDKGKTIVDERRDGKTVRTDLATGGNILSGIPTIVLINGGSASASEILAGALKDNGVATLIGEKSFGKGSVQQIENFDGGAALKVTVAKWFTPAGKNINKEGIAPDTEVKISDEDAKVKVDTQKDAATAKLQ